jgi:methionyl-tRNA synthetase
MHRLAIFHLRKNGLLRRKDWEPLERSRHKTGSLCKKYFSHVIFPAMLKAEGSYILPETMFLPMSFRRKNKLSTSKKLGGLAARILGRILNQQDVLRYALTSNAPKLRIMILPGKFSG